MADPAKGGQLEVMLVSVPDLGHLMPLLHIAEAVVQKGHKVVLVSTAYVQQKIQKKLEKLNAKFIAVPDGNKDEASWIAAHHDTVGGPPFTNIAKLWREPVKEIMRQHRPSVALVDFGTLAGGWAASELGIPLVMNAPNNFSPVQAALGLPDPAASFQWGGFTIGWSGIPPISVAIFFNLFGLRDWFKPLAELFSRNPVLVQTFIGLEKPRVLPSNIILTGPVVPRVDQRGRLKEADPELDAWLQKPGPPVVLVTTGSMMELYDWQVLVFCTAAKQAGIRLVWGLREASQAFLPAWAKEDPNLFIRAWLPQAELIADRAVKLVVTHCGWGGTQECVLAGKPMLCMPFFGDQPDNAQGVVHAGAGELICQKLPDSQSLENRYKEGDFTAESVATLITKMLDEPRYAKALEQLSQIAHHTGGAEEAARVIINCGVLGKSHLNSEDLRRSIRGGNPCATILSGLAGIVVAGLGWALAGSTGVLTGAGLVTTTSAALCGVFTP